MIFITHGVYGQIKLYLQFQFLILLAIFFTTIIFKIISNTNSGNVPDHIKNGNPNYKYPHDYKNAYVKQQYLPDNVKNAKIYHPKDNKNEKILKEIIEKIEKLN